jgi:hypothetical protein
MKFTIIATVLAAVASTGYSATLRGKALSGMGCDPNIEACRRTLEEAEVRVLAFTAWKEEATDELSGQACNNC